MPVTGTCEKRSQQRRFSRTRVSPVARVDPSRQVGQPLGQFGGGAEERDDHVDRAGRAHDDDAGRRVAERPSLRTVVQPDPMIGLEPELARLGAAHR